MEPPIQPQSKQQLAAAPSLILMFEDCLGCKWTLRLLMQIAAGLQRPSELLRENHGLSTKVLNQCLTRLIEYKILRKQNYAETPPKVRYHLTPFGQEFLDILSNVEELYNKQAKSNSQTASDRLS
jgi:DNA-binding HxlR family transcriptional regulator